MAFEQGVLVGKIEGTAGGEVAATRRLIITLLSQRCDATPVRVAAKLIFHVTVGDGLIE